MAKLKICGLTCKEDIEAVNEAKPDFAGFIIEVSEEDEALRQNRSKSWLRDWTRKSFP